MKLRTQNDRSDSRRTLKQRESPTVMQPNSNEQGAHAGNGLSLTLQPELLTKTPAAGATVVHDSGEVRLPISSGPGESGGGPSSRRSRANSHGHSHSHSHGHNRPQHHMHTESEPEQGDSELESGEASTSFSELRYLFRWLQKSLPFLVILSAKLVIQHALGLTVGVGLFTTFLYVNKNIQTQVFLQDRHLKLQCIWLLFFLVSSTLLLYYTFFTETLYHCLIFLSPTIEPMGFWEVLWAVGINNFILKFLFMGIKCLILLLPSSLVTYRAQLLGLYGQWSSLLKTVRIFLKGEHTGMAATRGQCNEAGDICPICQGEYREPRALLCQHIFCDECIALWFNREKSCPLCRTVITEKVYKWRDGATSPHLQIY
ncbi:E3 ubiquitin-protein ligase RNFT1 isoform X3 [Lampris incognitus]|uniref:E3 ubiquitin-protein ligase RNFT1 isoform X3 n=1 Tax=Lampris incognitus TaxID=2546036 RepID=UPI0024B5C69B|nr:E3 ubiquitin-protein ligase RNFT1 isoform X3 [Lampris incognitus]